ncbi:sensor histidine kinase [Paenibacillus nasutitermitis]|uniref:Sensor histidine kinase n=1 Tax=Paenibacillus nasutitermitis TaxID=1652958 RepID=A0A917E2Q8_9BACL|nr:sensor histidine kinase [Paenibacillus nasutitermitis]GGD96786.1 sensor histidine kinase [Paenibacillus nasutitermitis]
MNTRLKFRWRLLTIIIVSLLVLVPLLFQGYLVGQQSSKKIQELYGNSITKNMDSLAINIEFYLNYMKDFSRALSTDRNVVDALLLEESQKKEASIREELLVSATFYNVRIPLYIQIITPEKKVYSDIKMNSFEADQLLGVIQSAEWYNDYVPYNPNALYIHVGTDFHEQLKVRNAIYVSKNIIYNNQYLGMLVVQMNLSPIQRLMHQAQIQPSTTVFLSGKQGNVLIENEGNERDLSGLSTLIDQDKKTKDSSSGTLQLKYEAVEYVGSYREISGLPWYMVAVTPNDNLTSESKGVWAYAFIMMGISVVILSLVLFIITKKVTIPILNLTKLARNIHVQHMPKRYYYKGIEEIEILSSGMNQMLDRIEGQIEQIRKDERKKRELELILLQSQIKPHFLHNALNSIRWMAEIKGEKAIARALISLASMQHYILDKSNTVWSAINEEIDYIRSYLAFQEIRLGRKIECRYEIDEAASKSRIPKLSLQPIVENAVLHGFERLEGREPALMIRVFQQNGIVVIHIEDNGVGMDKEIVATILTDNKKSSLSSSSSGIGIRNVNKRLQLEYGVRYGVRIESKPDQGTVVEIQIVNNSLAEGDDNESYDR